MKKVFIISSILLAVVLVFLGIYNFVFKRNPPRIEKPPTEEKADNSGGLFDLIKKEKIYSLSGEEVISPALASGGESIIYYSKADGSAWNISFDGKDKTAVSQDNWQGLAGVIHSSDKNKVMAKIFKEGETNFYFYDYSAKIGSQLKAGVDDVVWTGLGDKIIYKYFDSKSKKRTLNIADPDGSNWKKLADVPYRRISIVSVPKTALISFWNAPDSFEETNLQTVGIAGGEPKTIFSGRFGADYLWSPIGDKILTSFSDARGGSKIIMGIFNSNGGEYKNLNIPTLISKSVWSKDGKFVYYALPGSIPDSSVMPNDYQENKLATQDTFWKVDVNTGKQERIIELDELNSIGETFDAENLFLSFDGDILFFVNKKNGKLYGINL